MKRTIAIFIIGLIGISCTSNDGANAEERREEYANYIDEPTVMTVQQAVHNFGSVVDGDMVKHTFTFTNTGEKDLVLYDVQTTCGCTVPEDWPKYPIEPGESGEIKVIFNSHDKVGKVNKTIRVEANTNPTVTNLTIIGEVTKG